MGCVTQIGEQGWNIGRMAPMVAGWPETVCGTTVDRQCGSSMQTNFNAAAAIWAGPARRRRLGGRRDDVARADGLERRRPLGQADRALADRAAGDLGRGDRAEWNLSRESLDAFSLESHRRAIAAIDEGTLRERDRPGRGAEPPARPSLFAVDEAPRRDTSAEKLASLQPAFLPGRRRHGRQLEPDRRRRRGGARHERGRGVAARPRAARPLRLVRPLRRRPVPDAARQPGGVPQGAREGGPELGRHRRDRGERGVRVGRAPVRARRRARRPLRRHQPERRRHLARPSARRDRRARDGDAAERARAPRGALRDRLHVHRLRPGDRRRRSSASERLAGCSSAAGATGRCRRRASRSSAMRRRGGPPWRGAISRSATPASGRRSTPSSR